MPEEQLIGLCDCMRRFDLSSEKAQDEDDWR